jgi:molybdopterin synthase sulfur carrier subunit
VITVVLLGKLADLGGAPTLSLAGPLDWAGLKAALPPALAEAVDDPKNRIAVDGVLMVEKVDLYAEDGAEIALLPPVSGG